MSTPRLNPSETGWSSIYGYLPRRDERLSWPTGRAKKSNPLGKIRYLWNCCRFFRQIYSIYRGGFKPHMLRMSLQKLMGFNRYNSLNFKIHLYKWTTVPSWIFSKKRIKVCTTFRHQFKRFSDKCQLPSLYLNRVFKMCTSCSNTRSKSLSKWQDCLINELLRQIVPYRQQGSLQLGTVGWFWHTFLIPSQDRAPHTIIQWTEIWISVRLFLSQNHSCSLWKMHI